MDKRYNIFIFDGDGYKFWERNRWKFNNPLGDQDDAYDELADLLTDIVCRHFDCFDDMFVRCHDENGEMYSIICETCDGSFHTAPWDWLEAQDVMYIDWVMSASDAFEILEEDIRLKGFLRNNKED